jgi:hypothetical protein
VVLAVAVTTCATSGMADQDRARPGAPPDALTTPFPAELIADSGPDEIAGEIAVDVRDDASAADIADIAFKAHIALRPNSTWSIDHDKIEVADVDPSEEDTILAELAKDPRVEHA